MRRDDEADNDMEDEDDDEEEAKEEDDDMAGLAESAASAEDGADADAKVGENAETERRCRATDNGAAEEMRGARGAASGPV